MSAIPKRKDHSLHAPMPATKPATHLKLVRFEENGTDSPGKRARGLQKPVAASALVATPELLAGLQEASDRLAAATPEEIIAWGVENYAPYLTMATAFGPEGCVILAMLAKIAPKTYVFNLDTGYQFKETLELRDRIA